MRAVALAERRNRSPEFPDAQCDDYEGPIVIADGRFANEIEFVTQRNDSTAWRIERLDEDGNLWRDPEAGINHSSESHVMNLKVDYIVPNNNDFTDLRDEIYRALKAGVD